MIIDLCTDTAALRSLWKQAFGDTDTFLDSFFSTGYSPDRCRALTLDGKLAAALYWFDCQWDSKPIAYLYGIATEKSHQRKGLCKVLMADTHKYLQQLGYAGAILVPAQASLFGFYEKMDYRAACYLSEFTATATEPITIREIDTTEYARERKQYLPHSSVIQEGATLDFLQTQAKLYAGNGFVLCATVENGKAIVPELLGNTEAAPAITAALGISEARFRVPGKDKPFAMYCSFLPSDAAPDYFGLALD